jgi:hypothetical protein
MNIENTRKLIALSLIIFFNTNLFSRNYECYSNLDLLEKTRYWSLTVIGKMKKEKHYTLFYAAYFHRKNYVFQEIFGREVNGALKSIKLTPFINVQVAIKDGHYKLMQNN